KTVNGVVINGDYGESPPMTRMAGNGNGGLNIDLTDETIEEILSKPPAGPNNLFGSPDYPIAYNSNFIKNGGPVNISVIDPLAVEAGNYTWWMDTLFTETLYNLTGRIEVRGDTTSKRVSYWYIENNETGKIEKSDTTIIVDNEQLFPELGFAVNVIQPFYPGPIAVGEVLVDNNYKIFYEVLANNNGLLEASMIFSDSSNHWLSGIEDRDIPGHALNWIRSGTARDDANAANNDWEMKPAPPNPWDPGEVYENMIDGTWAPYGLTAYGHNISALSASDLQNAFGPALTASSKKASKLADIASVDIVFTPDKTKWTRSPVLEMGIEEVLVEGGVNRFALRASPSVDKDGNYATVGSGPSDNENDPNYISDHGMGWFPGYCINVETWERLNIMYGENSYLVEQNGRDMLFNPPPRDLTLLDQRADPNIFVGPEIPGPDPYGLKVPVMGGEHYVFIQVHRTLNTPFDFSFEVPAYDAGRYSFELLDTIFETTTLFALQSFYGSVMYAGMPMGVKGKEWLSDEVKIRIRIAKPFEQGYSDVPVDTVYPGIDYNNYYPAFNFSMDELATGFNVAEKHQTDLDLINVVPNPYYAYSFYENNALDTRVKITNLPEKCKIKIFNVSGTKIREFSKDSPVTTLEWDLNNFAGVPVAGGVYYIHVKSDEGERTVKWFCIQRTPDLNTF
ncbi:MAG: T9SS type A sorting domain-containing protein, partial [Bacteroidales bacterium]|nr:T9SS type A sorting domain-containing protein [Bacteroidales bacterium]